MAEIAGVPRERAGAGGPGVAGGGRAGWLMLAPAVAWLALFYLVPLALIAVVSVLRREPTAPPVAWELSLAAWPRVFDAVHLRVLARSLGLAVAATVVCLVVGWPLAWFIVRRGPRLRRLLYFLVLIPLSANSLVLVFSWISILRNSGHLERALRAVGLWGEEPLGVLYSWPAVLVGLVYWYLPFMVTPIHGSLDKVDARLMDAAADLGAGRWQVFRRVLLPLSWPGIATGSLLVFLQGLCTFVVADLLGGSKAMMAGNLIQQRFLGLPQDWPLGSALSLLLLVVLAAGLWIFFAVQRRQA